MELPTKIIGFEGDDGSGKGTMTTCLTETLETAGYSVLSVGPNNLPPYAQQIRDIVVGPNLVGTSVDVQAMMFVSYLLNIYDDLVLPNWGKYDFIVMDRTYVSTQAYQDDSIMLSILGDYLPENMPMDVLVYLDVEPGVGISRIKSRDSGLDDFEKTFTPLKLLRRHACYSRYVESAPVMTKHRIDANREPAYVMSQIKEIADKLIAEIDSAPSKLNVG